LKTLETYHSIVRCEMHVAYFDIEPFRRGSLVWRTDRQTDKVAFEYLYSPGNPVATKKGEKQTHKLN